MRRLELPFRSQLRITAADLVFGSSATCLKSGAEKAFCTIQMHFNDGSGADELYFRRFELSMNDIACNPPGRLRNTTTERLNRKSSTDGAAQPSSKAPPKQGGASSDIADKIKAQHQDNAKLNKANEADIKASEKESESNVGVTLSEREELEALKARDRATAKKLSNKSKRLHRGYGHSLEANARRVRHHTLT